MHAVILIQTTNPVLVAVLILVVGSNRAEINTLIWLLAHKHAHG